MPSKKHSDLYRKCLVPTCQKRKKDFPDKLFYKLPRHITKRDIRHQWIRACKVDPSKILDTSQYYVVCDDHFESTDFDRDLKGELLGLNRLKKLKANAVPSINLPPENYQLDEDKPSENDKVDHQTDSDNNSEDEVRVKIDKQHPKKRAGRWKKTRRPPPPPRPPQFGCLICCKKMQGTAKITNYFTKYTCPGARDHDNQEGSIVLNKQLWHIFILRNILKIDSSKCAELLAQFGTEKEPDKWFHLCVKCGGDVARALDLHEQILKLEEEIREVFNGICETAKKTVEMDKDKDTNLKKDEVEAKLWSLIRDVNGIFPAVVEIKDEPMDDDHDSLNIPSSPVNSPISEKESSNNQSHMDLASRIDQILARNKEIVGEPLCRPSGLDSDLDSDVDDNRPKIRIIKKAKLIKPKPPPLKKQPPKPLKSPPKRTRNRKQHLIPRKHLDNNYTKFNCSFSCPAVFSSKELLALHIQAHKTSKENDDKFECKFCGFVILNEDLLNQHLGVRHHDQTEPNTINVNLVDCPCPFCEVRFQNHNILKYEAHFKLHEKKELNCPHTRCGYPAEDSNGLVRHLQNVHKERSINTCEICGYTVSKTLDGKWRSHLVMHKLNEYIPRGSGEESTTKYGCPLCPSESFSSLNKLHRHKRVSHAVELGLDLFLCSDCPRTFLNKSGLFYHVKLHHENDPGSCQVICETCGENFSSKFALKIHQRKHSNRKKGGTCKKCDLKFDSLGKLRWHEKKNCGKEAKLVNDHDLQEKKGMECIHCKIVLPHRAAMRRHVKIHAQHKCNLCGNLFLSRDNLLKHKRGVHKAGPLTMIKCQYCWKEFKHRINLYSHLTNYCKKVNRAANSNVKCLNCERVFISKFALNGHKHSCKTRLVEEKI